MAETCTEVRKARFVAGIEIGGAGGVDLCVYDVMLEEKSDR